MLISVFHLSVVTLNVYALWYDQSYIDIPFPSKDFEELPFKGRQLFLTIWCFVLQTLYFTIALLNDIVRTNAVTTRRLQLIRRIKGTLFSLAFPVAVVVSFAFWGLYFIDKDLIFPEHIEKLFPKWLNHTIHTLIVPFLCLELLFNRIVYPCRRTGIYTLALLIVLYTLWSHVFYFRTGLWVYPVLNMISWYNRTLMIACAAVLALVMYVVGEKLNIIINPNVRKQYTNGRMKIN